MKKQLLIAGLMALATHAVKADRFYQVFEKPYRQEVGLAISGTMMAGGLYKTARFIGARRPVGALLSAGLFGAGALGTLIAEGNSAKPKIITNERFPRLANTGWRYAFVRRDAYGMPHFTIDDKESYLKKNPHAALEGISPFFLKEPKRLAGRALDKTLSTFDKAMTKFDKAMYKAELGVTKIKNAGSRFKTFASTKTAQAAEKAENSMKRIKDYFRSQK